MNQHVRIMQQLIPESKVPMPQARPIEDAIYQRFQTELGLCDIPLDRLRKLCAADHDGRLQILAKHQIKDGGDAWTIVNGKVVKRTISHCKNPYRMYFLSDETGFPCNNGNIGINLFTSESDAMSAAEGKVK